MAFPDTLKDVKGIPISSVYIPGVGWASLRGSTTSSTDASFNLSTGVVASLFGKNATEGDTPVIVDSSGRVITTVTVGGTAPGLDNTNELRVSLYGKGAGLPGDTALLVDATGRIDAADRWARQLGQVDLARVNGAALSSSNPNITETNIQNAIRNGQGYAIALQMQTNAATGNFPLSVFNPLANTKNILIYAIYVSEGATSSTNIQMNSTTVDPAYGTNPTILNQKLGGAASSLSTSVSYTTTTQTLAGTSTLLFSGRLSSNIMQEMLNGSTILLPEGSANGLTIWTSPTGASSWGYTVRWIEY